MGAKDLQDVKDAVAKAKSAMVFQDWKPVVHAVSRLAMPDMLKSMDALSVSDRDLLVRNALAIFNYTSSFHRIEFAAGVIDNREIYDLGLPDDQVNDGREFLGCTRLDDAGVQSAIQDALNKAPAVIRSGEKGTEWASLAGEANQCCGVNFVAWKPILVDQRRVPGASLVSNLAAAAHYMLARFHVCAAKSTISQMRTFVDGYDSKKRIAIMRGDKELKSMALTANRPFPPDFAIRNWAYKGATDGEVDRRRCNPNTDTPLVIPDIRGDDLP